MRRARLACAVVLAAVAAAGCGVGAGEKSNAEVSLVVTRDFGTKELGRKQLSGVPNGDTVMRLLERNFNVKTRYGGGFVQTIDDLSGGREGGRAVDWFYYVNGIEAGQGAQARKVSGGDRIWWDHHDWEASMRTAAVVGSYPEPFLSGINGEHYPVRIDCAKGSDDVCDEVARRLKEAGVKGVAKAGLGAGSGIEVLRLIVGPWAEARRDVTASILGAGPSVSGVFAKPSRDGTKIELLDERGHVKRTVGAGSGLVAAVRLGVQQPAWFITGTDDAGVAAAAAALEEGVLQNRFAMAVVEGRGVPLPMLPEDLAQAP
jgi:hypothetical protein